MPKDIIISLAYANSLHFSMLSCFLIILLGFKSSEWEERRKSNYELHITLMIRQCYSLIYHP